MPVLTLLSVVVVVMRLAVAGASSPAACISKMLTLRHMPRHVHAGKRKERAMEMVGAARKPEALSVDP